MIQTKDDKNTSKFVKKKIQVLCYMSYFQLSFWCFGNVLKHGLLCYMY